MPRFTLFVLFVAAAVVLLSPGIATACPMCKAALASDDGGGNLVQGFMWSIIFMVSMPFTLLGSFCGCMYIAVRRAKAAHDVQPAAEAPSQP